jgi:hypothetical protein
MKSDRFTNVRIPDVKKTTSIVAKKDQGTPERSTPRPPRPDRGDDHPGRPDRSFEDDLPGEPIVPDYDEETSGDIIVPDRDKRKA